MPISPADFGASFQAFMSTMVEQAPGQESYFLQKLAEFFGSDPRQLPIVRESIKQHDHPNFQMALEAMCQASGRSAEILGFDVEVHYQAVRHADLFNPKVKLAGSVQYKSIQLDGGETIACLQSGLLLLSDKKLRAALLVDTPPHQFMGEKMQIAVMAPTREAGEALLAELRSGMHARNVYRGKILSLTFDRHESMQVRFHRLQQITRSQIILPDGLLERIESLTTEFSRKRERLRVAGRHLKRGVLLYGPPGTGKTLTAMYLAGAMQGRTVLLLTGRALGMIEICCQMARLLEPATVIMEDVDLVAEDRKQNEGCKNSVLFELLNQMDGLAEDMDVLFLLTTNRPEILEPALASRPGRIDQAFEVPLPDSAGRRQLLDLYSKGLQMKIKNWDRLLTRTEGASGAFIRELLRKAALFAADKSGPLIVRDAQIDMALHEMLVEGGGLTRSLLGFTKMKNRP